MADPANALPGFLAPLGQVGRYFSLVQGIPGLIASLVPLGLVASGAPVHRPDLTNGITSLRSLGVTGFALLTLGVVTIGLVLQPFQFATTQMLEGYWGTRTPLLLAMQRSTVRHLRVVLDLESKQGSYWKARALDDIRDRLNLVKDAVGDAHDSNADELARTRTAQKRDLLERALPLRFEGQEAIRRRSKYPIDPADLMPTRLGNVLRRYERLAGQPYGLEAIGAASILAQVAPKVVRDYYDDMRTDMDQATSLVAAWTFVAGSSFFLLWRHGPWLIVPALATLLAYGSYRSAVAAAEGFGEALMALVSLGRWSLYDALHVELPPDSTVERDTNALLNSQLSGDWVKIRYRVSGERAVPVQEQAETPGLEE